MKFKVGDKVKVREDLPSGFNGIRYLYKYQKGQIFTIKRPFDDKSYYLKEDKDGYIFAEEMLELVEKQLVKIGNYTIEKTDKGVCLMYINEDKITLKDLKLGDILTVRNGTKYIKLATNQAVDIVANSSWIDLDFYKNDLLEKEHSLDLDIMKVERAGVVIFERKEEKKEILDEQEKKYLRGVIRPFRDRVKSIRKIKGFSNDEEYIDIGLNGLDNMCLPDFKKSTMYKGMELDKKYTLEELGL